MVFFFISIEELSHEKENYAKSDFECCFHSGDAIKFFCIIKTNTSGQADHTPDPTNVTVAGSLQSELGCPGDWDPDCATTHLTYDASDDVWQGTFACASRKL